jgi:hypothetical protein
VINAVTFRIPLEVEVIKYLVWGAKWKRTKGDAR